MRERERERQHLDGGGRGGHFLGLFIYVAEREGGSCGKILLRVILAEERKFQVQRPAGWTAPALWRGEREAGVPRTESRCRRARQGEVREGGHRWRRQGKEWDLASSTMTDLGGF